MKRERRKRGRGMRMRWNKEMTQWKSRRRWELGRGTSKGEEEKR